MKNEGVHAILNAFRLSNKNYSPAIRTTWNQGPSFIYARFGSFWASTSGPSFDPQPWVGASRKKYVQTQTHSLCTHYALISMTQDDSPKDPTFSDSLTHSLTISLTHSLTHARTHSLTHTRTHSPTHSLTHSPTHARTHPHTHTRTHSPTHSLTHSPTHSLTISLTHSLTHPLTHSLTHYLTHSLTHSLTISLTHSLTHYLTISLTQYAPTSTFKSGSPGWKPLHYHPGSPDRTPL